MMRETWLKTNRRAMLFGLMPPLVLIGIGVSLAWGLPGLNSKLWTWIGFGILMVGSALVGAIGAQLFRPRVAYQGGEVLFYLRSGAPIGVPVEFVEAFFIGQGPVMIPGAPQHDVSVNLVARLSQREQSYAQREVKPALGVWSDGYVTMRGTWCEPINGELVRQLNHRLREVSEARAQKPATA